ncbi:MAG: ATP-binding protein [Treponema sp.]|nr:ATP-binding protein [Treponema sp.]
MGFITSFSGIKAKTTIYTIIPVIITFSLIFSILFVSLFNSQQNMVKSEFESIAKTHAANFEKKINIALDYLSSVASVLEFQVNEGIADREALQRIIYFIFDGHTVDSSSIYFEPDMYDGRDAEYVGTVYGSALRGRISYYFYRFNRRTGYRQAALDNDLEFSLPFYLDIKELNAPTYTEPGILTIDGVDTLKFSIAYPIYGSKNEFIGVITADIFLGDIYAELQAEEIYETGYIIIANDKQQLVYSSRFEDIGKTRSEAGLLYPLPPDNVTSEVFRARSILNNKRTLVSGQTVYFPQFGGRFYISVAAPINEINANGTRLLIIIISASVIILILIALFLYYLIGKMTEPIIEFTKSAGRIAIGDYSVRIEGDYQDEFAVLKYAMNQMTEHIDDAFNVLQNILNGIEASNYVTEPKTGKILFINEQLKKMFNIKDDVIGEYCYKVLQEGFDDICEFCPCHQLEKDPNTPVIWEEYNTLTKRYYHNMDCYIDWPSGGQVHLQHSVDVTDLKTITEEKIKAEETSRMKSIFLANMSHEIRTPMNAILGVTEILIQNDTLPAEVVEGLDKIYSSCNLLTGIINDILDFSKIEAGKLDIVPAQYKIASMINDAINLNLMRAESKPIEFELKIDENIPANLIGDELRIKQILNNLLSNAFKYTDAGRVTLSVEFEFCEAGIILVLGVRDSGHGMTEEQLSKMFDEYSRFNQNKNTSVEGTGLGLSITHRLINLMNGTMHVESKHEKGSFFAVKLPQKTVDDKILGRDVADNLKSLRMNTLTRRKSSQITRDPMPYGSVLVVDDVETNIYVAVGLLKPYKLKIDTAMSGYEALDKIHEGKTYDLIFMDHMMPDMDGIETVKKIRSWENEQRGKNAADETSLTGGHIPIVALTANAVMGQAALFLRNGFDDFISKPIDIRQLNSVLNKFIRDRQPPDVLEAARSENTGKVSIDEKENSSQTDTLLLKSFIRDAQKVFSWLEENADKISDEGLLHKFTVMVHGIKSSLWNIGEMELAESAKKLEAGGKEKNIDLVAANIFIFKNDLRNLLEKLELKQEENISYRGLQDGDINDLCIKLQAVREKAEDYDRKGALDELAGIKKYSKETENVLNSIMEQILHSNFEDVQNDIDAYISVLKTESKTGSSA